MGLYITAGVLVYALALYFVYWTCSAARTYSRFYETVMAPENDESPDPKAEALIEGILDTRERG